MDSIGGEPTAPLGLHRCQKTFTLCGLYWDHPPRVAPSNHFKTLLGVKFIHKPDMDFTGMDDGLYWTQHSRKSITSPSFPLDSTGITNTKKTNKSCY